MSFASHRGTETRVRSSWHGTATILEAILLLIFLLASVALMTKTLALSFAKAAEGRQLSAATMAAANTAELFAANPIDPNIEVRSEDGLRITCDVAANSTATGTLYKATIEVFEEDSRESAGPLYSLASSKFVREG